MFDSTKKAMIGVLTTLAVLMGCGDPAGPEMQGEATVHGRVEETTPSPSAPSPSAPQRASAAEAQTVAVVQIEGDGSFTQLAAAEVGADGSFTVEGVPAGRADLAVVAYAEGSAVGSVLIHEQSRSGATIVTAPIDSETTLEARAYARLRSSGGGSASGSSELSLFVHGADAATGAAAASEAEITATAAAYATARETLTAAYQARGIALDAATRAELMAGAAVEFASRRNGGLSPTAANELFTEAALDALVAAHTDLEAIVLASASAATTFDAALYGSSSVRGDLVVQPLLINLKARQKLAASHSSGAAASVALAVHDVLASAETTLSLVGSLIDVRLFIEGTLSAVLDAGADACVSLLAADASDSVRAEVRAAAEAAIEAARLGARLESTTSAAAAASVLADYRAAVRAAVEAMIEASGDTTADAEALTEVFIAASAGAHIRA